MADTMVLHLQLSPNMNLSRRPFQPALRLVLIFLTLLLSLHASAANDCEGNLADTAVAHHHSDLTSYIAGMEKSSLQKAALGSIGRPGRLADLGAGSGVSAYDLAVLFPDSKVTGVDLDPKMVEYANAHYSAKNLNFRTGDAEQTVFPLKSLDTIFISSTLHHLTSYGSGNFDVQHVHNAIAAANAQLKTGGVLILRDFVAPDGPEEVLLELPGNNGRLKGNPEVLSTSALFEMFARDFRSSQHPRGGVPYRKCTSRTPGWNCYQLSFRDAQEFILRKDYRAAYAAEIKEEYTFMNQAAYESAVELAGFRILHSAPIYNPWIIRNRYQNQIRLYDINGSPLPFPPTNFIIAAEKISARAGIRLSEKSFTSTVQPQFLRVRATRDLKTNEIFDLVERPGSAIDLLPYFIRGGRTYVLAKQGYPRPIATINEGSQLTGIRPRGYIVEPLNFLVDRDQPMFVQIEKQLSKRGGLKTEEILSQGPWQLHQFYTSPGLSGEQATAIALPIRSRPVHLISPGEEYSGFSTSGVVRPLEATQLLRSAQVGALLDARLESATYQLLLSLGRSVGPWIGEEIVLNDASFSVRIKSARDVLQPKRRQRRFVPAPPDQFGKFLEVRRGVFSELDASDQIIKSVTLEYVLPKTTSSAVISTLPVVRKGERILVGLEHRQLPGIQSEEGTSDLITAPAFRLPRSKTSLDQAKAYAIEKAQAIYNLKVKRAIELGGHYQPTKGLSPESVYPVLLEIENQEGSSDLRWVDLKDLLEHRSLIKDGHLMISVLRASHALGLLQ